MLTLETPITTIPRYGKLFAKRLLKLKIATTRDLLLYFPFRYDDLSRVVPIAQVKNGEMVTIRGTVIAIQNRRSFRQRLFITEALVRDASGTLRVIWFNQAFLTRVLPLHSVVWLSGKIVQDKYGLHLQSPVYEKVEKEALHTGRIVPIYSVTPPVTQKQLRVLMKLALPAASTLVDDLPSELLGQKKLLPLHRAVAELHFPKTLTTLSAARHRMAFAEFFTLHCHILSTRAMTAKEHAPAIQFFEEKTKTFVQSLPFQLTQDQRKAAWEIVGDLQKGTPMRRLLNGDVGSGKTVVAAIAALQAVLSGKRALFMVPTEILAEQHARTLGAVFQKTDIDVVLHTASHKLSKKQFRTAQIVIGTHALLHAKSSLTNVGLVIIDEQHRFGVTQRSELLQPHPAPGPASTRLGEAGEAHLRRPRPLPRRYSRGRLRGEGETPHVLTMTATPIPRTLAQTIFGDFDISFLRAMPKGRKQIMTRLVPNDKRNAAYDFIRKEVASGRQVFVICPLIDPSDVLGVRAATDVYDHLRKEIFPELAIGLLHGRVKVDEREKIMHAFSTNALQILVATSVVEVGIDIPNATIMMIEGAERFGLAQLHQLRGRVGRGGAQSYCFLFTDAEGSAAQERLKAMVRLQDGFALAEADLKLRGPGELFGKEQSGYIDFHFARWNDLVLLQETKEAALEWHEKTPTLNSVPVVLA